MKSIFIPVIVALSLANASADIISYLRFEEGSGFGAFDETGLIHGEVLNFDSVNPGGGDTGYNGWSVNVPSSTIPLTGAANTGSLRFAGGSDVIDLSNGNALSLGVTFTIEMFFRPDQPTITSPMFGFSPSSSLYWSLSETSGNLFFSGSFQGVFVNASANLVTVDEWQHFALVKELGEYSIYIDGQLQYNSSLPSSTDGPYFFPGSGTTGDRSIGDGFSGWIDEFRISDTALTPDQFLIVPEPSSVVLLALGGLTLAVIRHRRAKL